MLSYEYCEIFKSTRFEQHLRTADSELGSRFENHTDSIILLKYQSLANQYFKHNLRSMPSLNFTPDAVFKFHPCVFFKLRFINDYYTKSKRL